MLEHVLPRREVNRYGQQAMILLPVLFGFFLRFHNLGKQGLFLDEAISVDLVLRPWPEMVDFVSRDNTPLLYFTLLKPVISCLPVTEWTLRLLSASCSTLSLALAVGLARRLAGVRAAVWAGWVLAWSSLHLYYAQEARMYALLELLWGLSPWLLLHSLRSRSRFAWVGWTLATVAAVYAHFYGLLLWGVGALGSAAVILDRFSWREFRCWLVSQIAVAAAVGLLVAQFASTVERGVGGTWIPSAVDPLKLWLLALFGFSPVSSQFLNGDLISVPPWNQVPFDVWVILAGVITVGAVVGWIWLYPISKKRLSAWLVLTFGVLPPLVALFLLQVSQKAFWAPRPFIGAVVWLLVGLAIGWSAFPRAVSWAMLGLLLVLNLGPLWAYQTQWVKDYGRAAASTWSTQVPERTVLVFDRNYIAPVWNFYRPDQSEALIFGVTRSPDGSFGLRRVIYDGTLRGESEPATCQDLPVNLPISLYDSIGRSRAEGGEWPSCLRGRPGWQFNRRAGEWQRLPQLLPEP
jgi:uncharacterized membrane protein